MNTKSQVYVATVYPVGATQEADTFSRLFEDQQERDDYADIALSDVHTEDVMVGTIWLH